MEIKASIVVMSHLSDLQEERINRQDEISRMNFIKHIIIKCDGNLNIEIDADKMYEEFMNDEAIKNLPFLTKEEIISFVDEKLLLQLTDFLMDNHKLRAIKHLIDTGKKAGKRIGLKESKQYVDDLEMFLRMKPTN